WAEVAVRDLEEIVAVIALDSPINAERVLERIASRASTLESTPERGRVVPELAHLGMRTQRELVVKPYRLIYRMEGDTVTVLALFDGRRDLEDLLLERLVRSR
ncbi:MAG: type II toxin-antitoxin system RelE/ParE family toxin, partial [Deltaproteobacteria bacterium]|nr:type II toxin-antitoxin system RelE/ParE family toxin [Deltaproteobacteria bacterium]